MSDTQRTADAVIAIALRNLGPVRAFEELRKVCEEMETALAAERAKVKRLEQDNAFLHKRRGELVIERDIARGEDPERFVRGKHLDALRAQLAGLREAANMLDAAIAARGADGWVRDAAKAIRAALATAPTCPHCGVSVGQRHEEPCPEYFGPDWNKPFAGTTR